jgi:hypothetical protein
MARMAKLADARDLKSRVLNRTYRFNSGSGHQSFVQAGTNVEKRQGSGSTPLASVCWAQLKFEQRYGERGESQLEFRTVDADFPHFRGDPIGVVARIHRFGIWIRILVD